MIRQLGFTVNDATQWAITRREQMHCASPIEMCEHKGIGHPDSVCDGVAEAVSLALNDAYLQTYGRIQHYNVDKALLIGGESCPRFGGGSIVTPVRLIVCGRAYPLVKGELNVLVESAARRYLSTHLRCDSKFFQIESAVRTGSLNLQQVFVRGASHALANDTSFGVGFAPYSPLEEGVLQLGSLLRSFEFRERFPAAGDDFKVMGARIGDAMTLTLALAFIDREIHNVQEYFTVKRAMVKHLREALITPCEIVINTLDDPNANNIGGLSLTVTGLSAEHGDDGQVGRGNRMNGLITPCRSMSLEAAAGKNPVAHVGKLYNALAREMASIIVERIDGIEEATVQLLSQIGSPVDRPALVSIELSCHECLTEVKRQAVQDLAQTLLVNIDDISARLACGNISVF